MPKLKSGTVFPTDKQDAKIKKAVSADPDTRLLEDPALTLTSLLELKKRGRPPKAQPKVAVSVRYTPEVIQAFKASGSGWQPGMDAMFERRVKASSLCLNENAPDRNNLLRGRFYLAKTLCLCGS